MPRTADFHGYLSRAALMAALATAVFWTWKLLEVVLVHLRGEVGP